MDKKNCIVDGEEFNVNDGYLLGEIDSTVMGHIRHDYPKAKDDDFICNHHAIHYQLEMIDQLISNNETKNKKIEQKLTDALNESNYQIQNINDQLNQTATFGERVADLVAKFGGSWSFIIVFVFFLLAWMFINVVHLFGAKFDPYPFILLNLALSCIAALQSPIIMMSQNRSGHRDELSSDNDYHVNLKSENELRSLHAKLDQINNNSIPSSFKISQAQLSSLGEINDKLDSMGKEIDALKVAVNKQPK
ncbi:DUF1003 domain-containing protein (plasmid) [Nicoliella spurrieriana]|uniref:DUF1003 domain-containing protein n=1 Tax=Nicoliella spurrieriana TaxID=2925830 RepID=A0A976X4Z8_9LACO|nr:DUF1003 domain-containing protein [Nicoliella spurrieriana]UQS86027.1 DUF1003 domain-containing protein [Nicoliella spurrieriana]